jgi:hypothetical protein
MHSYYLKIFNKKMFYSSILTVIEFIIIIILFKFDEIDIDF